MSQSGFRLLIGPSGPAPVQMAADALLLEGALEQPVLRLYRFEPAGLTLGYFQCLADVPGSAERLAADPEGVARRLTGGGAIHHDRELTFAIAASAEHPLYRGPVADSYARVHAALAKALAEFGVRAELRGDRALASDRPGTGLCFAHSSSLDLVWERGADGRPAKGVGSAQRRRGGRVLHHGSIKLAPDPVEAGVATVFASDPLAREHAPALEAALVRHLAPALGGEPRRGALPGEPDEDHFARSAAARAAAFTGLAHLSARPGRAARRGQSPM